MPRTRVKICGITRLQDALAACEAGADALGFNFAGISARYVEPAVAAGIVKALPVFVSRVGVFVDEPVNSVKAIIGQVELDLLQFHGDEDEAYCAGFGKPYIKAIRADSRESIEQAVSGYSSAAAILLDAVHAGQFGGSGETFDWSEVPQLAKPVLLAGGLSVNNVSEAIRLVKPWAVDLASKVELDGQKGIKDPEKIKAFIEAVQKEDGKRS